MLVGAAPNQKRFTLHYDIVSKRIDLADGLVGATIVMKHWEPEIFSKYLHCDYFNCVHGNDVYHADTAGSSEKALQEHERAKDTLLGDLVNIYLMADEVRDLCTFNIVSDEIINLVRKTGEFPGAKAITLAYASLDDVNSLRKLLRGLYVHDSRALPPTGDVPRQFLEEYIERFHFGKELSIPMLARGPGEFISVIDWTVLEHHEKCQYHQHDGGHLECE